MDILVIFNKESRKGRKTIDDSLYCFRDYGKGHRFYYLEIQQPEDLSGVLCGAPFDGVIFHYSFMALRMNQQQWRGLYGGLRDKLAGLAGCKVAVPQDEYSYTNDIRALCRECGVDTIFTCARGLDYDMLYPKAETGDAKCDTVYTGYVDDKSLKLIRRLAKKEKVRDIDIGYRARALPYWLGRQGLLKTEIADRVNATLKDHPAIRADISTTGGQGENVFLGDSWYRFMLRCRTMLGCLGGSGLMDADGGIAQRADAYRAQHPDADFDEVEAACFSGRDGALHLYALSPRHFECAMTKTCQVLVEGDYFGVFEPGVHYIELKKDYSNLDEVLEKVQDAGYCAKIAQRCYDDVVAKPGKGNPNTYAWFANHVLQGIEAGRGEAGTAMHLFMRLRVRLAICRVNNRRRRQRWLYNLRVLLYNKIFPGIFKGVRGFFMRHPSLMRFYKNRLEKWVGKFIFKEKDE